VTQPERARLGAKDSAGAQPAQQRGRDGHLRDDLLSHFAHPQHGRLRGRRTVVSEGDVNASTGQLRRDAGHLRRRGGHDDPYSPLIGLDVGERLGVQDHARHRADLVGRHDPSADAEQHQQLYRYRGHGHAPNRPWQHAPRRVEHDVNGGPLPRQSLAGESRLRSGRHCRQQIADARQYL
jgi:hypothetical protein